MSKNAHMSEPDAVKGRRWFRSKPRGLVSTSGKIVPYDTTVPIGCRVLDMSAGGARLALEVMQDLPRKFEFIHGGTRKACVLAWRRGYLLGVTFMDKSGTSRAR